MKIIYIIFHPNKILGSLIFLFSAGLLIYVFSLQLEETFISYIAYLLSLYSLIIFIIWFIKVCHFSNNFIKNTKLYQMYKNNNYKVLKFSLIFLSILNLIYGIFKLGTGIIFNSWCFITFAVYYLVLCIMRIYLFKNIQKNEKNIVRELQKIRITGVLILFLNIILIGMIILIIRHDYYFSYPGVLIYLIALYDFYLIINAFINVFKYKKHNSPIISASKCINLTVAMISILSLEVSLIHQFGDNDANFKIIMTSSVGFGICLINSIMGIFMRYKSFKKTKQNT